jgi:hypothetical protein
MMEVLLKYAKEHEKLQEDLNGNMLILIQMNKYYLKKILKDLFQLKIFQTT